MPTNTPILILGGIGSGKSTIARLFRSHGVEVIDADRIGHAVLEPDGEAFAEVAERWPAAVVEGRVDRRILGDIVFGNASELAALEAITHPHIRRRIGELLNTGGWCVAVETPILGDILGGTFVKVVIDAPDDVRFRRLRSRGLTASQIRARMASQPSRREWLAVADHVIDNSGNLAEVALRVGGLISRLCQPAD